MSGSGRRQRWAELRLRPVRAAGRRPEERAALDLSGGSSRSTAPSPSGPTRSTVRRGVRRVRLPPRGLLPVLRPGRGDAHRHGLRPAATTAHGLRRSCDARTGRRRGCRGRVPRGEKRRQLRAPGRRAPGADRGSGDRCVARAGTRRRDSGLRPQRRVGLLGTSRGDPGNIRGRSLADGATSDFSWTASCS